QRQHLILAHEISELNIHLAQLPSRLSAEYRRVCDELAAVSVAHHDIATDYRIDADDRRARGALGYGRLVAPQLQPTSKPDRERYDANDGRPPPNAAARRAALGLRCGFGCIRRSSHDWRGPVHGSLEAPFSGFV